MLLITDQLKHPILSFYQSLIIFRRCLLHKLTTDLTKNHSRICLEDLKVSGMMANHKLAKSIADMGFREFRRQLDYKCQLYGSELLVVDRWFPSSKTCSNCGAINQRVFIIRRKSLSM
jgi:putative transposase